MSLQEIARVYAMRDLAYLKLLSREYPSIRSASGEMINLLAIQGLPKGTEYFFSDLHGEHEAFIHLLRRGLSAKKSRQRLAILFRKKNR